MARVAADVAGSPVAIIPRIGGTLPIVSTFQNRLNVAGIAAPGNPFYFGAKVHAPNEHVKLDDVGHAVRFTYALLEALGEAPPVS